MSIYTYPAGSTLDKVSILHTEGGGVRAYLHASDGIDPTTLEKITQNLEPLGWQGTAIRMEGKDYFEVRGFEKEENLIKYLKDNKFVTGAEQIVHDKKVSRLDQIKHNKLYLCGILNVIADAGYIGYGLLDYFNPNNKKHEDGKSKWENVAASFAYSAGSLTLFNFGHADKSDSQLKDISAKTMKYALKAGLEMSDKTAVDSFSVDHKEGIADNISGVFHTYPSEIFNVVTAMAGAFITTAAIRHDEYPDDPVKNRFHKQMEIGLGTTTTASGLLAAFVKEKVPDPNKPPATGLSKVAQFFQARPNRIAGYGYFASSLFHAVNTIKDFYGAHQNHDNFGMLRHTMRGMFVSLNLAAEVILSLASKGHGEGVKSDASVDQTTYALVADLIARQPKSMHEKLITDFSTNFLAHPDVLGGDAKAIADSIREQVTAAVKSPWAKIKKSAADAGKSWESRVSADLTPATTGASL